MSKYESRLTPSGNLIILKERQGIYLKRSDIMKVSAYTGFWSLKSKFPSTSWTSYNITDKKEKESYIRE